MNRTSPFANTLAALAGVGFAVLIMFTVASIDPLRGATDQELIDWWADSANRQASLISMFSMLGAAATFVVFLNQLCGRLRGSDAPGSNWSGLAFGSGLAFAALLAVAAFSRGVLAHAYTVEDEAIPGPDTIRFATALSQAAFGIGAIPFAGILIATVSVRILRTAAMPKWLGWLGLVVTALTTVMFAGLMGAFATPFIVVWTVATSFVLWRSREVVVSESTGVPSGRIAGARQPS